MTTLDAAAAVARLQEIWTVEQETRIGKRSSRGGDAIGNKNGAGGI
jgi:hypothetical protein